MLINTASSYNDVICITHDEIAVAQRDIHEYASQESLEGRRRVTQTEGLNFQQTTFTSESSFGPIFFP